MWRVCIAIAVCAILALPSFACTPGGRPSNQTTIKIDTVCASLKTAKPPPDSGVAYKPGRYPDQSAYNHIIGIIKWSGHAKAKKEYTGVPMAPQRKHGTIRQLAIWTELGNRSGHPLHRVTPQVIKGEFLSTSDPKGGQLTPQQNQSVDTSIDAIFKAVELTRKQGLQMAASGQDWQTGGLVVHPAAEPPPFPLTPCAFPAPQPLVRAWSSGAVSVRLIGDGTNTLFVKLQITNNTLVPLRVAVPAYSVFVPDDAGFQTMITTDAEEIDIPPACPQSTGLPIAGSPGPPPAPAGTGSPDASPATQGPPTTPSTAPTNSGPAPASHTVAAGSGATNQPAGTSQPANATTSASSPAQPPDQSSRQSGTQGQSSSTRSSQSSSSVPPPPLTGVRARQIFTDNFDRLDENRNGVISKEEIEKAVLLPSLSVDAAALVAYLYLVPKCDESVQETFEAFEELDGQDGISREDIRTASPDYVNEVAAYMRSYASQLQHASLALYSHPEDPLFKSIVPEAVTQGNVGDCYFLSAVCSLAAVNPQAIADMIRARADGTYTVTFPGDSNQSVTVRAPTLQELMIFNRASQFGIWVNVLEKAYGTYCNRNLTRRSLGQLTSTTVPEEATHGPSFSHAGLRILTGLDVDSEWNTTTSEDSMHESLRQAIFDGRPITAYTGPIANEYYGLIAWHEYAVTGYNHETRRITIQDPHGEKAYGGLRQAYPDANITWSADRRSVSMPLTVFDDIFRGFAYAEKP